MYNGIGLPTPRGSGTNGYVQRNLAQIRKTKHAPIVREETAEPNYDVILHQRKREIEAKCMRLRKSFERRGKSDEYIEEEVVRYRKRKLEELKSFTREYYEEGLKRSTIKKEMKPPVIKSETNLPLLPRVKVEVKSER